MYNMVTELQWIEYLETPRKQISDMKLDRMLQRRMKTFLRAHQIKLDESIYE